MLSASWSANISTICWASWAEMSGTSDMESMTDFPAKEALTSSSSNKSSLIEPRLAPPAAPGAAAPEASPEAPLGSSSAGRLSSGAVEAWDISSVSSPVKLD